LPHLSSGLTDQENAFSSLACISHQLPAAADDAPHPAMFSRLEVLHMTMVSPNEQLLGLFDRIAVMHDGAIEGILPRTEATQDRIMELALQFTS
jgi:hypothetical protein